MTTTPISVDEFQALEQRVLRTVELIRKERELRSTAEQEITALKELLDHASTENTEMTRQLEALRDERTQVKSRVDAMLQQMDEIL